MDQKLRTERRKLADLKAAEYNPRKALTPDDAEYQKIRRSIEEFGYVDPIIINEDGTIIGGHQRATVLKDLGYQEVDVVVVALDKQREKALNIALNKITGEWDEVKLKDLLLDLDLGDYDISLTGFEQNDLTELVDKLAIEPEAVDDDFNEDEALEQAEAEPVTKLGDVWLLGRHRLMCGDSTSQDDMAVLMNGEIADLVVTDPPYNVNYGDKAEMLDNFISRHIFQRNLASCNLFTVAVRFLKCQSIIRNLLFHVFFHLCNTLQCKIIAIDRCVEHKMNVKVKRHANISNYQNC